ncbi:MAG: citrate transporter [Planctomycetes bacterium]|nr:citrate transporter [Planctomycetota bacterium]
MDAKRKPILASLAVLALIALILRGQQDTVLYSAFSLVPLLVILGLLFLRVNILIAGMAGGVIAMIAGGITMPQANGIMIEQIRNLMGIAVVPILNPAVAMAVFKSGGYLAALALVRRSIGGNMAVMGAFIVFLQAAATYMSGIGGGSAMVIAPLAFAAVGAIPAVIVGMSIAAATCFTTSRASLETATVLRLADIPVDAYANMMFPYMALFVVIGMGIAAYGAWKNGGIFSGDESEEIKNMSTAELKKATLPAVFLLLAVVLSPVINNLAGFPLVIPLVYAVITLFLVGLCTKFNFSQTCDALIDGSSYILTRLFQVGLFLMFITLIERIGAFATIAAIAENAPINLMVPAAVLAGFLIGVPAGGYVATILGLILPVTVALGFPPLAIGFVTMGVGFGSQMCPVNITMQALSFGFRIPILQVVRGNAVWILPCVGLLMLISFI